MVACRLKEYNEMKEYIHVWAVSPQQFDKVFNERVLGGFKPVGNSAYGAQGITCIMSRRVKGVNDLTGRASDRV